MTKDYTLDLIYAPFWIRNRSYHLKKKGKELSTIYHFFNKYKFILLNQ